MPLVVEFIMHWVLYAAQYASAHNACYFQENWSRDKEVSSPPEDIDVGHMHMVK